MPLVAIVGRPNVGKSTLFNRLTEARHAIVHDEPGVTRDRVYGDAEWNGVAFEVVDTGGFVPRSADKFEAAIREQVHIALDQADAILFIVDVTTGVTDLDEELARILRKTSKPVLVVANKADNERLRWEASAHYALGLGEIYPVSSISGMGSGELLDQLVKQLPPQPAEVKSDDDRVRLAFVGRPNVGKSSVTNALLGKERSIVTDVAGTTRDSINSILKYQGEELILVDTAGLRKKARVRENIEFYSLLRTERAIRDCDVAILLVDATQGFELQDVKVLRRAADLKKGLVIAVNKWDLVDKETNTARDIEREIRERIPTLDYVPIVFVSAVTKQRLFRLLDTAIAVAEKRRLRIPTSQLNDVVQAAIERHHPPTFRNRFVQIKYASQVHSNPPVIAFFCNQPKGIRESYQRFLENTLRKEFDFGGVPLTLSFRQK